MLHAAAAQAADAPTAAAATNAAPATKLPPAKFSVLNKPEKPIEWGGVLVVGISGALPGPGDEAKSWSVGLNGVALGVAKVLAGPGTDHLPAAEDESVYRFVLTRLDFSTTVTDKSAGDVAAATVASLAPRRWNSNPVKVQLAYNKTLLDVRPPSAAPASAEERDVVSFRLASLQMTITGLVVIFALIVGMIIAARRGAVLRDEMPAGPVHQRLYSLGRTQLAFWVTLIVSGFIFLYLTTGQFWGLLNSTALALLGISAGTTALSQVANSPAVAPNQQPANLPQPQRHVGFVTDILSDAYGMNIHRLQMVIWTLVFGIVFVKQLVTQFSFPVFDSTTFGLMGISSATYVWFKRTEA